MSILEKNSENLKFTSLNIDELPEQDIKPDNQGILNTEVCYSVEEYDNENLFAENRVQVANNENLEIVSKIKDIDIISRQSAVNANNNLSSSKDFDNQESVMMIGKSVKLSGGTIEAKHIILFGLVENIKTIKADMLIIEEGGCLQGSAQIIVDRCKINGVMECSEIIVNDCISIKEHGEVCGDLSYKKLLVAEGGIVSGSIKKI